MKNKLISVTKVKKNLIYKRRLHIGGLKMNIIIIETKNRFDLTQLEIGMSTSKLPIGQILNTRLIDCLIFYMNTKFQIK
jgi:hypothetical protein